MRFLKCCIIFLLVITGYANAQETATISGIIKESNGKPFGNVNIALVGVAGQKGESSNDKGQYSYTVPSNTALTVSFSYVGFVSQKIKINLKPGERKELDVTMQSDNLLKETVIEDRRDRESGIKKIDAKSLEYFNGANGSFEDVLKTVGANSNNELSSQYSVRGGNFDENLVYVNDIEVYRPFLVRSGQQEGLSFINSDMVSGIAFSAGGFDAKYGDKLSSVLDIKYKRPEKFGGSASGSLLGGSLNLEGRSKNNRFTFLIGARQKSNQYLLGSLDTKADYRPSYSDVQTYLTYAINEKLELSFLGNYSRNQYLVVPQNRETSFGTVNDALRLTVYFDGQELDSYETSLGALSFNYKPTDKLNLKFIGSAYKTYEKESFDIQGQYYIDQLESDLGKSNFGDVAFNRGVGTYLNHARTDLDAFVYNFEHKGFYSKGKSFIQWGAKYQHEDIDDRVKEWKLIDSADYSLPHNPNEIQLQDVLSSSVQLHSNRVSGFLQENYRFNNMFTISAGVRSSYWDLNNETVTSPRGSISFKPNWKRDIVFRASSGFYYQPPFYRELRDPDGNINKNLKAQKSIHYVLGADYNLKIWDRPFKYVAEVYYKYLDNLVPYKVDNVRITYFAKNSAQGYATGVDMRLNGEFIKGIESWASLSLLKTEEDIKDDFYYDHYNAEGQKIVKGYTADQVVKDSVRHEPGYIPRPTDQRFTFSLFFQDYLPRFPTCKMHLTLVYGSSLPFGPPGNDRYKDTLRVPAYRRVDIGFSKQIIGEKSSLPARMSALKYIKSMWLSIEVYNLLEINNTISYLWVTDVTNRQYAVPNYLTSRQLNAKLVVRF